MNKTILLVDGDLAAYRNAAAGEARRVLITHKKSGKKKEFENRTEFKAYLKKAEFEYHPEEYVVEDILTPPDPGASCKRVRELIDRLEEFVWADKVEVYIGSGEVFRHRLPLPSPYKNNRADAIKPTNLPVVRDYLKTKFKAEFVEDIETDDMLTIRAYEEKAKGNQAIIASIDKDNYQCNRIQILNWTEEPMKLHTVPDLGHLRKEKSQFKGDGLMFLAYQMLAGDPVDTYKPYELSELAYGATEAYNSLRKLKTEQDILKKVIETYKYLYPGVTKYKDVHGVMQEFKWDALLRMYFKCAYMLRSRDDTSDADLFFESKGVKIE